MAICLIGVGSNLGDRAAAIESSIRRLADHPGVSVLRISSNYGTKPIGGPNAQAEFVNAALVVETPLAPSDLLVCLQSVERQAGRTQGARWGPRPLDLDLLLYDDLEISQQNLIVPHPRMAFRRFVLVPAAEVGGELLHPSTGRSIRELLQHLDTAADYVAVAGAPGTGKTDLVKRVCARTQATPILQQQVASDEADSPSRSLQTEIQFLDHRWQLLQRIQTAKCGTSWISDFWLDQSFAFARLASDEMEEFKQHWQERKNSAIAPKLLVLLDAASEIGVALSNRACISGLPPVLKLDAAQLAWNEEELAAAILAMR